MKRKIVLIALALMFFAIAGTFAHDDSITVNGVTVEVNYNRTGVTFYNNSGKTVTIQFVVHWEDESRRNVSHMVAQNNKGGGLNLSGLAPKIGVKISHLTVR
jgi:hypothetical protein